MDNTQERMQILEMIESGRVSADEGLYLLRALTGTGESASETLEESLEKDISAIGSTALDLDMAEGAGLADGSFGLEDLLEPAMPEESGQGEAEILADEGCIAIPPEAGKWRRWWRLPLWIGVGVTVLGGLLMYWAMQSSGLGLWFIFASMPFAVGVLIIALAWSSRKSPWLFLRVQQEPREWPQHFALSFPIPVRPAVWFLRSFGHKIPRLEGTSLDEILLAIGESINPENPIYIKADEGEDGERVEIYIG